MAKRFGRVVEIASTGIREVDLLYLSSVYGGEVPSDRIGDQEIKARTGWYQVRIALDGAPTDQATRGTIHRDAKPETIAAALWRRVLQVLVRESGASS